MCIMGPPLYMRSAVDWNVVMRRIPVYWHPLGSRSFMHHIHCTWSFHIMPCVTIWRTRCMASVSHTTKSSVCKSLHSLCTMTAWTIKISCAFSLYCMHVLISTIHFPPSLYPDPSKPVFFLSLCLGESDKQPVSKFSLGMLFWHYCLD